MTGVGSPSWWQTRAANRLPTWRPASPTRVEILVVGAGLAGASAAATLRRAGREVLLIDALGPGAGASGRNAGFVMLGNAMDYPRHVEALGRALARQLLALGRENHRLVRERHGARCGHQATGSWMLAERGEPRARATLERAAALLDEDGVEVRLEPAPDCLRGFGSALAILEDGAVDPARLLASLVADTPGVRGRVAALDDATGTALVRVADDTVELRFDRALVCANAFTRALLPELAAWLTPQRAQIHVTAPAPRRLARPCYAGFGYDYFRQLDDGRVLVGGRRHLHRHAEQTGEAEPTAAVQADLDVYRRAHLPFADVPVERRWAGIMGFSVDEMPILGRLPTRERVHACTGFTGHGLSMAVACGRWAAQAMLGDQPIPEPLRSRVSASRVG